MSMLVRKATLSRPNRNRRAQSQRAAAGGAGATSGASSSVGGALFGRSASSRSPFSGVSFLRSSLSFKAGGSATPATPVPSRRAGGTLSGGSKRQPSPSGLGRLGFLPVPEEPSRLSRHGSSRHYSFKPKAPAGRDKSPEVHFLRGGGGGGREDSTLKPPDHPPLCRGRDSSRSQTPVGRASASERRLLKTDSSCSSSGDRPQQQQQRSASRESCSREAHQQQASGRGGGGGGGDPSGGQVNTQYTLLHPRKDSDSTLATTTTTSSSSRDLPDRSESSSPRKTSANLHPQNSANLHPQNSANLHPQNSANLHPQNSANLHPQNSANLHLQLPWSSNKPSAAPQGQIQSQSQAAWSKDSEQRLLLAIPGTTSSTGGGGGGGGDRRGPDIHLLSIPGAAGGGAGGGGGDVGAGSRPGGAGGAPWKQYASSLKESELSKPKSDLPFTRADLPVRHSSLPARRLDSTLIAPTPVPAPGGGRPGGVAGGVTALALPSLLFGGGTPNPAAVSPGQDINPNLTPQRHCSLPPRYLDLPRSRLDFPLRRPDSEQAYRELAEREQHCRNLIASMCYVPSRDYDFHRGGGLLLGAGGCLEDGGLQPWDHLTQDLYQGGEGWRRPSVDNCQRSELLQQVIEANKDADTPCDFVCRVTDILSTTVATTILLFLALAIPIIMMTMGVKYLDDCPLEPRVPVYLLVGGCFLALKLLGMLWRNVQFRRYDSMDAFYDSPDSELALTSKTFRMMDWILSAFLLAWHVAGACWVLSLWRPPSLPSLHQPSAYCGSAVYWCAVGEIMASGALIVLGLLGCGVLALCYKYTNMFEQ